MDSAHSQLEQQLQQIKKSENNGRNGCRPNEKKTIGTNNLGEITTYHVESGKTFWKMMNKGENIPVINPIK
ncbi:predicted protein [Listeria monocytogenes FSL N1-017]|nr:predicted protein [Listeria monocytogenes FSL N1-017]